MGFLSSGAREQNRTDLLLAFEDVLVEPGHVRGKDLDRAAIASGRLTSRVWPRSSWARNIDLLRTRERGRRRGKEAQQ